MRKEEIQFNQEIQQIFENRLARRKNLQIFKRIKEIDPRTIPTSDNGFEDFLLNPDEEQQIATDIFIQEYFLISFIQGYDIGRDYQDYMQQNRICAGNKILVGNHPSQNIYSAEDQLHLSMFSWGYLAHQSLLICHEEVKNNRLSRFGQADFFPYIDDGGEIKMLEVRECHTTSGKELYEFTYSDIRAQALAKEMRERERTDGFLFKYPDYSGKALIGYYQFLPNGDYCYRVQQPVNV